MFKFFANKFAELFVNFFFYEDKVMFMAYRRYYHKETRDEKFIYFSLLKRNSEWGLRDIDDLEKLAQENGLKLIQTVSFIGVLSLTTGNYGRYLY